MKLKGIISSSSSVELVTTNEAPLASEISAIACISLSYAKCNKLQTTFIKKGYERS